MADQQEPPAAEQQQQQRRFTPEEQLRADKQQCAKRITMIFEKPMMQERLLKMAGGDVSRVAKNLNSFCAEIINDEGSGRADSKKYLCHCTVASLALCFLESMQMQLPFDSRRLISMINYDGQAQNDISYKGFINALSRHYANAYVDAKVVFEGDGFDCEETSGKVTFKHLLKDPFASAKANMDNVRGAYCYFTYTLPESGEKIERIVRISKSELMIIRSKAKTKNVWDEFPGEQIIKSIVRRAAKIPFAAIDLDTDIEGVDNKNYLLENKSGTGDRLALALKKQRELIDGEEDEKKPEGGEGNPGAENKGGAGEGETPNEDGDLGPEGAGVAMDPTAEAATVSQPGQPEEKQDIPPEAVYQAQRMDYEEPGLAAPKREITDADFEEMGPGADNGDKAAEIAEESRKPAVEKPVPETMSVEAAGWTGQVVVDGKRTQVDPPFANAVQAVNYLKRIMKNHKSKASRLNMITENNELIAQLVRESQGSMVSELHKIASEGA